MSRALLLAMALRDAHFFGTAQALESGGAVNSRGLIRMLRWAVRHYHAERPKMARALKLAKSWARSVTP